MTTREFEKLKIGDRLTLRLPHPYARRSGEIIAFEVLDHRPSIGARPRLRLDGGAECYLIQPRQAVREKVK